MNLLWTEHVWEVEFNTYNQINELKYLIKHHWPRSDYEKIDPKIHTRLQNSIVPKILEGVCRGDSRW